MAANSFFEEILSFLKVHIFLKAFSLIDRPILYSAAVIFSPWGPVHHVGSTQAVLRCVAPSHSYVHITVVYQLYVAVVYMSQVSVFRYKLI